MPRWMKTPKATLGGLGDQPKWKALYTTDSERVLVDETGKYAPEMEVAQETHDDIFHVFRFSLDRLKAVKGYLVPGKYRADWPHPLSHYEEWFTKSLASVARSAGSTEANLRTALCSVNVKKRAQAYRVIGGYHGFMEFDQRPLTLSSSELDERWSR